MTGGENQAEQLVAEVIVERRLERLGAVVGLPADVPADLGELALLDLPAPDGIDGAPPGHRHQPGARIGGHAGLRPCVECRNESVLGEFLGPVYIAGHAGQAREEPGPFHPEDGLDRAVSLAGHVAAYGSTSATVASALVDTADPVDLLGEPWLQSLAEVGRVDDRTDLDLARPEHRIGTALHPFDGFGEILDLP